jgi:hypothetical protein
MHLLLREWDLNAGFLEGVINRYRKFASSEEKTVDEGPAEQRKIKRAVAEPIEYGQRCRLGQDRRMLSSDSEQKVNDAIGISAIGDTDGDADPAQPIEKGPVDKSRPHKLAVRDYNVGAIGCAQHAGAKTDFAHLPEKRPNLD